MKTRHVFKLSKHASVWVAKTLLRRFLILLCHCILLTRDEYLSTLFLLLEDMLLHKQWHHSHTLIPHRMDCLGVSRITARWWCWYQAPWLSTSIHSWSPSPPNSSPFGCTFLLYRRQQAQCVCPFRATRGLDTFRWYPTQWQPSR